MYRGSFGLAGWLRLRVDIAPLGISTIVEPEANIRNL